jgi:hypothetical protein
MEGTEMRGGPSILHIDDIPSEEVARYRLADGRIASVREKWIELSPRYVAFYNEWDPGALSPLHGHHGDHSNFILRGSIRCGSRECGAGTHIMLEYGDLFGPWEAGPDGSALYGFVAGEGSAYGCDPDQWQSFLAQRGVESLAVPRPRRIPPWWLEKMQGNPVVNWLDE